jgi:RNA polymerase sigma-70 factor (ECF subfamily)
MNKDRIEQLFRQHYAQMTRLAMTLLYDEEESRDVVSEVFATLLKTDIAPKNIESYLLMSVRNRCLNLIEHKSVRAKFEHAYTIEMKSQSQSDDEDQLKQLMAYAEQHLSPKTLRVFRMRHLQGMKYQEIADQLGISRVMVYKYLSQAMETIREYRQKIK